MFLARFALRAKERGSAMLGVLGVMGVGSVIALTVTAMSMHAVGYTSSIRAGVEAEAAAEAGVDFAAANLATSVCQSQYSSSSAPKFSVAISYSTLATSPGDVDTSWVSGCPTTTSAQRLKLVSTGWANTLGVAGNSTGNVRKVEAIYPYTPTPPPYQITPSGSAIYAFAQIDPTINNLTLTQASSTRASIEYLSGSATCTSQSTIMGDVILGGGGLAVTSGCTINGDLWASNTVNMQSGEVTGNVNVAGVQNGISVTLATSAIVDGNIYAAGPVSSGGKTGGNVVAGPTGGTSSFSNKSSVGGSVISAGTVSAASGSVKGTITQNQTGIVTPVIPTVPPWVDFPYDPTYWKTSSGAPYSVLTMTACDATSLSNALVTAQNSPTPIIVDTRVCGVGTDLRGYNLVLTSDVVVIANGFNLGSNNFQSSSAPDKRFWLIIPDSVPDHQPTCPTGGYFKITNHVQVGPHLVGMVYSPCSISNAGDVWTGQMYASSVGSSSPFTLNYVPLGLPGVNLSTGEFTQPPGTGILGGRTSIRDLVAS